MIGEAIELSLLLFFKADLYVMKPRFNNTRKRYLFAAADLNTARPKEPGASIKDGNSSDITRR